VSERRITNNKWWKFGDAVFFFLENTANISILFGVDLIKYYYLLACFFFLSYRAKWNHFLVIFVFTRELNLFQDFLRESQELVLYLVPLTFFFCYSRMMWRVLVSQRKEKTTDLTHITHQESIRHMRWQD
jgi:hypothetical protein